MGEQSTHSDEHSMPILVKYVCLFSQEEHTMPYYYASSVLDTHLENLDGCKMPLSKIIFLCYNFSRTQGIKISVPAFSLIEPCKVQKSLQIETKTIVSRAIHGMLV